MPGREASMDAASRGRTFIRYVIARNTPNLDQTLLCADLGGKQDSLSAAHPHCNVRRILSVPDT
jgi:hypothetical protein